MKISVIIPSYKPRDYLFECLDSLSCQTFPHDEFEVVLILNGCKEPYISTINSYLLQKKIKNISFIQLDESGVSIARNVGMSRAKGEYITFIDDDDYVSSSYLEELYRVSTLDKNATAVSNVIAFVDETRSYETNYKLSRLYKKIKKQGPVSILKARMYMSVPVAKLIKKSAINGRTFNVHLKNGEDSLFMLELSDQIKLLRATDKSAVYYRRIRSGSATTRGRSLNEKLITFFRLLVGYLKCLLQPWRYNSLFTLTRIAALIIYF